MKRFLFLSLISFSTIHPQYIPSYVESSSGLNNPFLEGGRTEVELEGTKIPIFDRERTIIDAFRLLSRETAIKALKAAIAKGGKNRIDLVKLQEYAKKLRFNITSFLMSVTT